MGQRAETPDTERLYELLAQAKLLAREYPG